MSAFFQRSLVVRLVWVSQEAAIIFLIGITQLILAVESVSVYCAVRNEVFNIIRMD
jgi:hypothetical protein